YRLALRNTLLFQVKHLRHPLHVARLALGVPVRILADVIRAPLQTRERRFAFVRAVFDALPRLGSAWRSPLRVRATIAREAEFFRRYSVPQVLATAMNKDPAADEQQRWRRHPLSRWYLPPLVEPLVRCLAPTAVRPHHITSLGLIAALLAAVTMIVTQHVAWWSIALVWFAWLCDRTDGPLARRQLTATARGARFDAATDEIVDLGLHGAVAAVAAAQTNGVLPWLAFATFVVSKRLFAQLTTHDAPSSAAHSALRTPHSALLRTLYHLPGNTDVRLHLLLAALITGWLEPELFVIAGYYTLRWIVVAGKAMFRAPALSAKGAVS
ncbi:MAG: CDP-alcohol phosphatidyltransferase family protein, partial [Planctomycetaceae bacterium]|nr:CDP-alcohol phosphatidyltransferase family protein [Planctomycetaceae bacterium]